MRIRLKIIITLVLSILTVAAVQASAADLKVMVSIVPQKYFVDRIAGDLVETTVMVKPGSSPATYEPKPSQMAALSASSIYFAIGVPFEKAWLPRFHSANEHMEIVDLSQSVVRMAMKGHHHHEKEHHNEKMKEADMHHEMHEHMSAGHGHHFMPDPHIWLSPALVRVMIMDIRNALIKADPAHESVYESNYLDFVKDINSLDSELAKSFKNSDGKSFMVYHPSWGYMAKAYGLHQIPIELEGKEPSPKELAQFIDLAEKMSIKAIFIQPQFSKKSAQAIAQAIGAKVLVADPLAYDWMENLKNVGSQFLDNVK